MREALFPDHHAEGTEDRVQAFWDLSWPVPVPRVQPHCSCGSPLVLKDWRFHTRDSGSSRPWRWDTRFKCVGCSLVTIHGIPVDKNYQPAQTGWITWREGKRLLAEAGFFEGGVA